MIFDPDQPGSLRDTADSLQRLAVFLRERTSNDLWQVLSTLAERLAMPAGTLGMLAGDAVGVLNQTLLSLAAFHGLARENMTRAHGWRFLDMGQRIERSIHLCAFLDHALAFARRGQSQRAGSSAGGGRQHDHLSRPLQPAAQSCHRL